MRKSSSTNLENELLINGNCGMAYTLDLIGGRWKPSILYKLLKGSTRYSQLRKTMPAVSERILILQLRELESDGVISRTVFPEVPPRVEYQLTDLGKSLEPVLRVLSDWGDANRV
ncbi:winged helix-turn-helix transcriptional regulator [Dyadobacter psychrophilus]|uniref:Transcriptional regulator, HxlR family n=1 Tax=Dyadobacter psychrophilus TaxID=651661 RepID=A0A1T5GAB6_9BACT|nr:helix-turn-helix domain-containing protein [Dyadobacter psychrophilus]SKC05292.1 transcriptional regulator, HxlR family [Dyadobacter psychrophilus]